MIALEAKIRHTKDITWLVDTVKSVIDASIKD